MRKVMLAVLMVQLVLCLGAVAQDTEPAPPAAADTAALAKAAQNPVSSMISLPIQYNINLGAERYYLDDHSLLSRGLWRRFSDSEQGPDGVLRLSNRLAREWLPGLEKKDRTQQVINLQPVVPVSLGKLNLINRFIIPVIDQPVGEDESEFGLGDVQYSMFFSPAKTGRIIWGVGPNISLPTATDDLLGTGKWSAGPGVVVLAMPGKWVVGALVNNMWSFAGESDRPEVNAMVLQPFINRNFKNGWYATTSPIITANWKADSDQRWTIPVGAGFGKIFKVGKQAMNGQLGAYYNIEKPDGAADWNLRFQLQFMFPK